MRKIRQALRNLALDERVTRVKNHAIACALFCFAISGCSFGKNGGLGGEDFLPNVHSNAVPVTGAVGNSQADIVANNTLVEVVDEPRLIPKAPSQSQQRAGSIPQDQQLQQQPTQQFVQQQQPSNNHPVIGANQNQYQRADQSPSPTHLSNAAQAEYLAALTQAGMTDPIERAEALENLAGMTSEGRKTFFKLLSMSRKGQPAEEPARQVARSANHETERGLKGRDQFGRDHSAKDEYASHRQPSAPPVYEQTPSGPKPRLDLATNFEDHNDQLAAGRFDNPLKDSLNKTRAGFPFRGGVDQNFTSELIKNANKQAVIQASFADDAAGYDWDQKGKPNRSTQRDRLSTESLSKATNDPQLDNVISQAEDDLRNNPGSANAMQQQIRLRLLYAIAGKRDRALEPIAGMSRVQQEFLNQQVFGLAAMMPSDQPISFTRQVTIAAEHFKIAAEQLGQSAGVQIKNPALCTKIEGFGKYIPFETESFRAGQEVLLYAELENFRTESNADGFHTRFNASYQVIDTWGKKVEEHDLSQVSETIGNRRRDYFVSYNLHLPSTLMSGEYTLKLRVEDLNSGLFGENSLKFKVGQSSPPLPTVQR